ncbi:MAG: adenylate/guanylate cyclase domain-containing protein [Actinobacteria bacterium]|nr:adenylate/guanylate cyclase domain-containing protein [Actinomycetota bacterium]
MTAVQTVTASQSGAIVFTDIVGFTELTELHGDDVALSLVDRLERAVHATLPPDARVVKVLGDGMLLWFDRADEAIVASVELQSAMDAGTADDALPLWVRTGVHWGTPRWRGDDIIGRDVNLTARVTALAAPREVLCTDTVVEQAGTLPTIAFTSLGSVYVKGIVDAVPVLRAERLTLA